MFGEASSQSTLAQESPSTLQTQLLIRHHRLPYKVDADVTLISTSFGRAVEGRNTRCGKCRLVVGPLLKCALNIDGGQSIRLSKYTTS